MEADTVPVDPLSVYSAKSSRLYEKEYHKFMNFLQTKGQDEQITEENISEYFVELSGRMSPKSLWTKYFILKAVISRYNKIDLGLFGGLKELIQDFNKDSQPYVSKNFTRQQLVSFLSEAVDPVHLFHKVVLILATCGGLYRKQIHNLDVDTVIDETTRIRVIVAKDDKTGTAFEFYIYDNSEYPYATTIRRYMDLRPKDCSLKNFMLAYKKGKVLSYPAGINSFGTVPPIVARFLKLPEPDSFTARSLISTSKELCSSGSLMQTNLSFPLANSSLPLTNSAERIPNYPKIKEEAEPQNDSTETVQDNFYHTEPEILLDEATIEGLSPWAEMLDSPGTSVSHADIISKIRQIKPGEKQHIFINCVFKINDKEIKD